MIALHCVGFCHIVTCISHRYTYAPLPLPIPSYPLGYYRVPNLSFVHHTVNFYWLSNFTYGSVYISIYSQFIPRLLPQLSTVHSLCLRLYSFPANRFTGTIFLDSMYIHYYTIYFFLFLTYFIPCNRF